MKRYWVKAAKVNEHNAHALLDDGWEPFAVTYERRIRKWGRAEEVDLLWLRKLRDAVSPIPAMYVVTAASGTTGGRGMGHRLT